MFQVLCFAREGETCLLQHVAVRKSIRITHYVNTRVKTDSLAHPLTVRRDGRKVVFVRTVSLETVKMSVFGEKTVKGVLSRVK